MIFGSLLLKFSPPIIWRSVALNRGLVVLGLITQALLVAVQLHALAALVLCDLGFAFLFD